MDFQLFLVGICVIWAGSYVTRRAVGLWRNERSGCGSSDCGGCPSNATGPQLVELSLDEGNDTPPCNS